MNDAAFTYQGKAALFVKANQVGFAQEEDQSDYGLGLSDHLQIAF
jgi:hypothetical protein